MAIGGIQNFMPDPAGSGLIANLDTYNGYDAAIASGQVSKQEADYSRAAAAAIASANASQGGNVTSTVTNNTPTDSAASDAVANGIKVGGYTITFTEAIFLGAAILSIISMVKGSKNG